LTTFGTIYEGRVDLLRDVRNRKLHFRNVDCAGRGATGAIRLSTQVPSPAASTQETAPIEGVVQGSRRTLEKLREVTLEFSCLGYEPVAGQAATGDVLFTESHPLTGKFFRQ
jgi:hypothetical protein